MFDSCHHALVKRKWPRKDCPYSSVSHYMMDENVNALGTENAGVITAGRGLELAELGG